MQNLETDKRSYEQYTNLLIIVLVLVTVLLVWAVAA
jgi:hypothetical protein